MNHIAAIRPDPDECIDFEVAVPAHLAPRLGATVRATLTGAHDAPLVVALGGISADRFAMKKPCGGTGWWKGLVGEGCVVDSSRYRVLGFDFAADATGSTAPSTREQAEVLAAILDAIGADRADAMIGASYGAMIALAFAEAFPDRVSRLVVVSAADRPHPSATAMRELQRRTVALGLANGQGEEALGIARGIAMMTYRTRDEFAERFEGGLHEENPLGRTDCGDYLRARGAAYPQVMSPERFLSLSASIDRHKVDPAAIHVRVLLIGATSDQLVPPADMQRLAGRLAGPTDFHLLDSFYGHDMFLKNADQVAALVAPFLKEGLGR